ncbi:unnamed protein product [Anisakis simplex]|uniref:C2H2-type domain-containing protein n=1 Tax=Anisakis simplex TaxID=6269 RepID=A0A0M3K6P8_ANISI|nr:unnamed protein product [Anisakis simplex]
MGGRRRRHRERAEEAINDVNVRYTNFVWRVVEGEPGHPETRPEFVESDLFASEMNQWAVPVPAELNRGERPPPEREGPAEPEPQPEEEEEDANNIMDFNEINNIDDNNDINNDNPNDDININEEDNINDDDINEDNQEINDDINMAQPQEGPAQPRYFLRRPHVPRQPLRRQHEPQVFRPHNIENLRPEHQAELTAPEQEAYHVNDDNTIWCRLPGCARPNQPFKTVRAWKIHVQRAACHRGETLCTSCGHHVAMPSSAHLSAAEIKTIMDAHKTERCVGATRQVMKARKTAAERLMILGRDNSHIAVPDEDAEEVQVSSSNPRKRHLASEAAWRADQCCLYLKRFKEDHPDLMAQIGMEHQLRFD